MDRMLERMGILPWLFVTLLANHFTSGEEFTYSECPEMDYPDDYAVDRSEWINYTVATTLEPPFMMKKVNSSYRGYLAGLAGNFSCLLSVNIIITEAKGGTYGSRNPDGSWTGIIGQVMRKEIDFGLAPITQTAERAEVVDFTSPFMNGDIVGILKTPKGGLQNLTFDTLANHTSLRYGAIRGSATDTFIKENKIEPFLTMARKMQESRSYVRSMEDGMRKVRRGGFVFLGEEPYLRYQSIVPPCELSIIGGDTHGYKIKYCFIVRKASPLKELLNSAILTLRMDGDLQRLHNIWWKKGVCTEGVSPEPEKPKKPDEQDGKKPVSTGNTLHCDFALIATLLTLWILHH